MSLVLSVAVNGPDKNVAVDATEKKSALELYLIRNRPKGQITSQQLTEYTQAQRDMINQMKLTFGAWKHNQKIEPPIFTLAKIVNVISAREFYAIQLCHLEGRLEFQNTLNRAYEEDCEPIDGVKVSDLCVVLHNGNWCRAEVVEMIAERVGKMKAIVYLLDYGQLVCSKKRHLYLLKTPHNFIKPFAMKCQLTIMNKNEDELDGNDYALSKSFEQFAKESRSPFLLYLNRSERDQRDCYNVILLADDVNHENVNTVYNAYLVHETYGAFIRSNVRFDNEICARWSTEIRQMINESNGDHTKKMEVFISHIVSPVEIYVRCRSAQAFMSKLRRIIDVYANDSPSNADLDVEWSTGMDCLVRLQNWITECRLKQWYRGRIADKKKDNRFRVFLRDYGRSVDVSCNDLKSIPEKLAQPADVVQKCSLSLDTTWTEYSANLLHSIVHEYHYFAISSVTKQASNLLVTLWATIYPPQLDDNIDTIEVWDNIGLRVISQSIIFSMEPFIKKSQRRYEKIQSQKSGRKCATNDDLSDDSDEHENFSEYDIHDVARIEDTQSDVSDDFHQTHVTKWLPPLQIDRATINGLVTHITDHGIIYAQEESDIDVAYHLRQSIYDHLATNNFDRPKNHSWHKGDPCFAEYDRDNFYRAVILKMNPEDATCLIHYVDYGDKAIKKLDDLFPATNFGDIPVLVYKFYVPTLVPADKRTGKWSTVVMAEIRKRLQNEMCKVGIIEDAQREPKPTDTLPCTIEPLILPCDIHKWLLREKLAFKTGLCENGEECLFI